VKVLPELVRAAAEPVSAIDKLTVISTDGASQITRSVATNVEQGLQIGSDLTGVDFRSLFGQLARRSGVAAGVGADGDGDGANPTGSVQQK
jgi:flotillin